MTAGSYLCWPEECRVQAAPTPTEAYFARRREEALDALAQSRFERAVIDAIAAWLRAERDAGGRLPDRARLGDALVRALDGAHLSAEATSLREDLDRGDDGHDLAPAGAALIAFAVLHLFRQDTDARTWCLLSTLRRYDNRLRPAVNGVLAAALRDDDDFRDRFLTFAEGLVTAAIEAPERQVMAHEQEMFARALQEWRDGPNLQELWGGLRGLDYIHLMGEATEVFKRHAEQDPFRHENLDPSRHADAVTAGDAAAFKRPLRRFSRSR